MTSISSELIAKFLDQAVVKLTGDWVIIGGSVLPMIGLNIRVTLDIDLAGPPDSNQGDTLLLMEIAESLGLPVEAINQAGAFFLYRIPNWQAHLVEIKRSERCRFFRPDTILFFQLKLQRFSQSDFLDLRAIWQVEPNKNLLRKDVLRLCETKRSQIIPESQRQQLSSLEQFISKA